MEQHKLKSAVHDYWNRISCGTEYTNKKKFSSAYFDDIESLRYTVEPEIFSFAQFTRFHKTKVLEVGIGAGTDFLQWVRAGTYAYGIDLTQESIHNTIQRLQLAGLQAVDVRVGDAEHLPYANDFFDCVYSWGVIHHSPDTIQCLREMIRVARPGGSIKCMIYNRHSLFAFYRYLLCAFFKGKPFQSLSSVLFHHQESIGTKAFTIKEIKALLAEYPVTIVQIKATTTRHDRLYYKSWPFRMAAYVTACVMGWDRVGWHMTIELKKK